MNGGLVRLREIINDLTPSEQKVAKFVLNYPDRMIGMSIAHLAEESGGSKAAVIRLCKSMGLKSYQELMLKVAGDMREEAVQGYQEIRPQDSIATIVQNVSNNNIQSIRDTLKILDVSMVAKAIEALHSAKSIFYYGVGASNLIAQDAQNKFMRINKPGFSFSDTHLQLTSLVTITERDVAVGISYSGETAHVASCLKKARELGAITISITKYGHSRVSTEADIPLYITSTENEIRIGAMSSRITQLNVIDILYLGVASIDYEESAKYLKQSRETVNELKGK
ncbi:MurR/RpiR family transcriptional regulator [Paenibacillus nasutitermitis]|uniref:HTH-type transcriptional regulator n=1 Tax=Paenibacillus nasutitermitis TaxID=1652958 RepID=A0A917DVB2_9BACL|nr:MurR/RpiR family transcriptional regulator [Paenibacillus nasutitermitis]GGD72119.1 putative HTH-type transcriptional regulator [Paenibacillus nasutitermitis]